MVVFDTLKFRLTVDLVAEAIGVKNEGEMWFKKLPFTFDAQRYLLPNVTPDWNKGILIQTSEGNGSNLSESYRAI